MSASYARPPLAPRLQYSSRSFSASKPPATEAAKKAELSDAEREVERVRAERERKWKESEERKKRLARAERERERVYKMARGSGKLTQWFGGSDDGERAKPPRVRHDAVPVTAFSADVERIDSADTATEDADTSCASTSPTPRRTPPAPEPRARVGCCSALHCRDAEHEHGRDWTVMGDAFRGVNFTGRAARLDMVPDPYTLSHFPVTLRDERQQTRIMHRRDDTQLRTAMSATPMDAAAMLLAVARIHHTESVNLQATYARDIERGERDIGNQLVDAYARDVVDRRAVDELEQARIDLRQTHHAVYVNASRGLLLHVRRAIANILADCDVRQPAGVPMIALADALQRVVVSFAPDCDESALAVAIQMALDGRIGDELDAQLELVDASDRRHGERVSLSFFGGDTASDRPELADWTQKRTLDDDGFRRPAPPCKQRKLHTDGDDSEYFFPCAAQIVLAPGMMPCTSIALHMAKLMLTYCATIPNNAQLDRLLPMVFTDRALRQGIQLYTAWFEALPKDRQVLYAMQTFDEAVEAAGGTDKCFHGLQTRDYYGNVFARTDVDASDELHGAGVMRDVGDLVDALAESEPLAVRRVPMFCVFTCSGESFVFGSTGGGRDVWWLFDSHDLKFNGRSTAGKFRSARAMKQSLVQRYAHRQPQATLDFSAVAIYSKAQQ